MFTHLVLDVDAAPGILSAPVPQASLRVSDGHVGANNCERHPLPHPVVLLVQLRVGEPVNLDLVLLKLQQNLKIRDTYDETLHVCMVIITVSDGCMSLLEMACSDYIMMCDTNEEVI